MLSISTNPLVLLLLVNVLLLVVGMFLDSTTAILVIAPIIAKPRVAAGVDPVHLGMVVVFNLMIGSASWHRRWGWRSSSSPTSRR